MSDISFWGTVKCFSEVKNHLLHFVAFFHVALLLSTGVDNEKVGVDNVKS